MANHVNILMTLSNLQLTLHGGIILHSETYTSRFIYLACNLNKTAFLFMNNHKMGQTKRFCCTHITLNRDQI